MQNIYSMSLAQHFMQNFDCDWITDHYRTKQLEVCADLSITPSDTVIFGHGGPDYDQYNRGIVGNNRVCISEFLHDLEEEQTNDSKQP